MADAAMLANACVMFIPFPAKRTLPCIGHDWPAFSSISQIVRGISVKPAAIAGILFRFYQPFPLGRMSGGRNGRMAEKSQTSLRGILRLLMWVAVFWHAYGLIDLAAMWIPIYLAR
jgi:hypothetical protein